MPRIIAVGRALPPYKLSQEEVRKFAARHFASSGLDVRHLLSVFDNSGIRERYFSVPAEWYSTQRGFAEKNDAYIRSCTELGIKCSRACLELAGLEAGDINCILFVSTTGLATPSIDAHLINALGLRSDVRRIPIWGLGCAGGAAGLSHAYHYLLGHPREKVLLVAVELCGLTFQQDDFSKSSFVAMALFGEGAAAVVLSGDETDLKGASILGTGSTFWHNSLEIMGWNLMNTGMQVVFSRSIPHIVRSRARENLSSFIQQFRLSLADIDYLILHPGGIKVVEAYEEALELSNGRLDICRASLRDYGNMSAVSVLFVLDDHIRLKRPDGGAYGLVSALGPGFCSENLLLQF